MKITKTYNWSRRDFCYEAKCEGCGNVEQHGGGYDDANYYENVVPNQKCKKCGESTNTLGLRTPDYSLKHDPNAII